MAEWRISAASANVSYVIFDPSHLDVKLLMVVTLIRADKPAEPGGVLLEAEPAAAR
jgi:hypothetical protein